MQLAKTGALWIAGAVLLHLLPWFGGPGWVWSAVLLGGAGWIRFGQPKQWQLVAWSLVAIAHALDSVYLGLGALPWLVGGLYSLRAVLPLLDFNRWKRGYVPYAFVGSLLCLWSGFWRWGKMPPMMMSLFLGGFDYHMEAGMYGRVDTAWQYNPLQTLAPFPIPGFEWTGRGVSGWFVASLWVLFIGGWSLWKEESARYQARLVPVIGALWLLVWVFPELKSDYDGPWIFAVGALGLAFCALKTLSGQQAGAFDGPDVAARVKRRIENRKARPL